MKKKRLKKNVYLLPGLGADERLFEPQLNEFENVSVLSWIEHKNDEDLSTYCQRLAAAHRPHLKEPYVLGGMTFGSIVSIELTKHLNPEALFLLAGFRSSSDIQSSFHIQAKSLQLVPDPLVLLFVTNIGLNQFVRREGLSEQYADLLKEQAKAISLDFFRWSVKQSSEWSFHSEIETPFLQVQGENDYVCGKPPYKDVQTIEGGNHLVQYTHAEEVNKYLEQVCELRAAIKSSRTQAF